MGLTNAAPTFQRLMDSILGDLDFVSCYLDDVLICSRKAEDHLAHVTQVLERLQQHRLIARETKCSFFMSQINFLGFVFSQHGRAVDSSKTAALCLLPPPDTVHELQRWLGAVNYYSPFIPHFADLTAPLTDLLRGHPEKAQRKSKARLPWRPEHQAAFEAVREALARPPLLRLFDPALPCVVSADCSRVAIGGVLEQEENGLRRPVAYYSRKLSPAEQRYTTRERECLAVKHCLLVWRHYLLGAPFTVRSDHESLKWLQTQNVDTLSDRLLRWLEYFSLFDFRQEYIPGDTNVLPDHFSRPVDERPPTQVSLLPGASAFDSPSQPLDLVSLVELLQEDKRYGSVLPILDDTVLPDSQVHSTFFDQIVEAQRSDPALQDIVDSLGVSGQANSGEFRTLYEMRDNVLGVPEPDGSWRLVIPEGSLRADICRFLHDEAGHPGVQRTLLAVSRYFYWPNMSRFVTQYVSSCTACQAAKASNRRPAGFSEPVPLPAEPATDWTIDFLELPTSANGFSCVLVCTERLSKLVVLAPLSNKLKSISAFEVARAFVDNVVCWFGLPTVIFSDRGPQFRSAVWHELWSLLGTTVKHSTPHTPHSHGDVERQNRVVNEMLRTMMQTQFADLLPRWDEHIKILQLAMNSAYVA
jgi:hypothetical protein